MKEILNKNNKEYAYECLNKSLKLGLEFKLNNDFKEKKYYGQTFEQLLETPISGTELKKLLDNFKEEILPFCSNFGNVNFMGFPDAGNSIAGMSGAIISDMIQQNLINSSFCAPIATYMEISVIKWFRELLGFKTNKTIKNIWDVGGIITYGGTGSNATAMLLARENYNKNTMKNGINNPSDYKILIPKGIGHYSIRSSSMWIGCGDNVIEVETNNFRYDLDALKDALEKNRGKIMCVVAYVGDSRTMTIENLKEVHRIVKEFDSNIWLHADACHGFSLAFSEKLKSKISGIELFDSVSTDPHKVLAIPYCVSALLVKEPEKFKLITSSSDLIMQEDYAWGQVTPFIGSKSWVSLKIWFVMKNIGIKKIGEIIERRHNMALKFAEIIKESNDFILLNEVNINSVVFMYTKGDKNYSLEELNKLNIKIQQKMLDDGKYFLHKFSLPDDKGIIQKGGILYPLRYMSGNDNICLKDLKDILKYIRKIVKELDL